MEFPENEMASYIKTVLSENPFYLDTDDEGPDSLYGKKITKNIDLSNYFCSDAYAELSQCVLVDIACENLWKYYIAGGTWSDTAMLPDITSSEAKESFDQSFLFLCTNWHKFTPRSGMENGQRYDDTDTDLPFSVFKAIYGSCPELCIKAFPVVLFIIADSFYDFFDVCSSKTGYVRKNLEPEARRRAFDLFLSIVTQDNRQSYLLSLLNSKGLHYAESSIKIGKEISALALRTSKNDIDSYHKAENDSHSADDLDALVEAYATMEELNSKGTVEQAFRKLKKRYSDEYEKKRDDRTLRSFNFPTEPMIGENFLAFLNLLINQPDNMWKAGVDKELSLYAINRITGWVSLYLLHNTFPYANLECGLSSFDFRHLYSLKNIMDQVKMESDYSADDVEKYPFAAWLEQLLLDSDKLYALASKSGTLNLNSIGCDDNMAYRKLHQQFPIKGASAPSIRLSEADFASDNIKALHDNYEAAELYETLAKTLHSLENKENCKWFDLDRLASQLTYYTLGQYAKELSAPVADDNG